MPSFQLFRTKVLLPPQLSLLPDPTRNLTRSEILRAAIESRPTARFRENEWHIGNVEPIDANALYFRFGRASSSTLPQLDPDTGDFVEAPFPNAPFTHVVLDVPLQVCAIAGKSQLAPATEGIARALARVLNRTSFHAVSGIDFTVEPLRDPESFLEQLQRAKAILQFSMEFSRPNPIDSERDFQETMQRTIAAVHGTSGRATLYGDALSAAPLAKLTRAAAASGNNASARLRFDNEPRPVTRELRTTSVSFTREDIDDLRAMKPGLIEQVRQLYARVRRFADG